MLPNLYHTHHNRHLEDLPFWHSLAQTAGSPILELGCGTGRVLLPLAQAGYTLTGLDNDPHMLAHLRRTIPPEYAAAITLAQADLATFRLPTRFPLIILPCNTYSILTAAQRQTALQTIRRHLAPGGLFAVSLPNPAQLADLPPEGEPEVEEIFPHPTSGLPVQALSAWRTDPLGVTFTWHYDQLLTNGDIQRESISVHHQRATKEDYLAELRDAGLQLTDLFGDFDRSPLSLESPFMLILAVRPKTPA